MEATTGVTPTAQTQTVNQGTSTPPATPGATDKPADGKFETFLRSLLSPDQANKVSEEELFAAVLQERVQKLKGDAGAKQFSEELEKQKGTLKKADGFVPMEDAAKAALSALVAAGTLTAEEGDKLYSEAFAAAQLDSNTDALYDNKGGSGDPTIAVDTMEAALLAARVKVEKYDSGAETAKARALSEPSNGKSAEVGAGDAAGVPGTGDIGAASVTPKGANVDGPNGFLFKPEAGDGKLAVLLPGVFNHRVESLVLKGADDQVIESGHFVSFGDDGSRAKYSFSKPGADYPSDLTVEVRLSDGTTKTYKIPDPSKRYD